MDFIEPLVWYIAFLFSATVHEAAHAWTAKIGGDLTAYEGGQVSLDPIPHIKREPIGMTVLPIITSFITGWPFGYASAPYNPYWASRYPHKAAWMALAGPASNFAIVLLCIATAWIGILLGFFHVPTHVRYTNIVAAGSTDLSGSVTFILSILFTLNLVMTILNLIPLPPLDGSAAITLFMSEEQAGNFQEMLNHSPFRFLGLFIAWKIFDPIFNALFILIMNIMYPGSYS
ncbi:MAG: site-2 protease family protein [Candidatus Electrothrix sp. AUS4]|nr:site-2 protease family protein [Candidatus Electrothrix sp. AUS4]